MNKITLEQTQELHDFLQGEVPDCITMEEPPKLTPDIAYSVIWYLQEHLGIIPDIHERCDDCGIIFNAELEGANIFCKQYCGNCDNGHWPNDEDWEYGSCDGCLQSCDFTVVTKGRKEDASS